MMIQVLLRPTFVKNYRTPSSMEFHGTALVSEIGALQVPKFVLNFDRIPWNLSFQSLMKIKLNFAAWVNFRKLISTLYFFVILFPQLMFYLQYLHQIICIPGITHYVSKYHSKSLFNAHWNVFWSKSSMELSPEFNGTFRTTFEQHLWFHGIPWNLSNKTSSSMEFHGIWPDPNGTFNFPEKSSMEFHGTW